MNTRSILPTALLTLVLSAHAESQTTLVRDIGTSSFNPGTGLIDLTEFGSGALFFAYDRRVMWTDGTATGTTELRALAGSPGDGGFLVVSNQAFFFTCLDDVHELWRTDGTPAGTRLLARARSSMTIDSIVALGNRVVFPFSDSTHGGELWISDGTVAGTGVWVDAAPGPDSRLDVDTDLAVLGNQVVFAGLEPTRLREPYVSDGTLAGTTRLLDINPGGSSEPVDFIALANGTDVVFSAWGPGSGIEVWHTDGTTAGTALLADIAPGSLNSRPREFARFGDRIVFSADDRTHGREPWITDGTTPGTRLLVDLQPGTSPSHPRDWLDLGLGRIAFVAQANGTGTEPYHHDGMTTRLIRDVNVGGLGSDPELLLASPIGDLWFRAKPTLTSTDYALFRTNGPAATATLLTGQDVGNSVARIGSLMFFGANDPAFGEEPWRSDGWVSGTRMAFDLTPPTNSDGVHDDCATEFRGDLLFYTKQFVGHAELWRSDGTLTGTSLVYDIGLLSGAERYCPFTVGDEFVMFPAGRRDGFEPWRTDGTPAGTRAITDIAVGPSGSISVWGPTARDDKAWFSATDGIRGEELWRTDGTARRTVVSNISAASSSCPEELTTVNDIVFLSANDGPHGREPWFIPARAHVPRLLLDINPGSADSSPGEFTGVGAAVFFVANTNARGAQLFVTDGTIAGTRAVCPVGCGFSDPRELTEWQGELLFVATSSLAGEELWISDGTITGTRLFHDLRPGPESSSPAELTAAGGDAIFMRANDGRTGDELWILDRTRLRMVADIDPGLASSSPQDIRALDDTGWIVFSALAPASGREVYVSNGDFGTTRRAADVWPGAQGSRPTGFVPAAEQVFFAADDGTHGRELHSLRYRDLGIAMAQRFGVPSIGGVSAALPLVTDGHPIVGSSAFAMRILNARPGTPTGLILSLRRGSIPLGGTRCSFYVPGAFADLTTTADAAGTAVFSLPVPSNVSLRGFGFYAQGAAVDAGGCVAGIVSVSNGVYAVLGQ